MMKIKHIVLTKTVIIVCMLSLVILFLEVSYGLGTGWVSTFIEARKQAVGTNSQNAIREATQLTTQGQYVEAFRRLFDAMYQEERMQLLLAWGSDGEFPMTAGEAILTLETRLVHEDPSPLLQRFRNPDVPIQDKLEDIKALRKLARKTVQTDEDGRFRGKYDGTLVQLLTSPRLSQTEKFDILAELQHVVQTEYVSEMQQGSLVEDITHLRENADYAFREQQYVEAFILLTKAREKIQYIRDVITSEDYESFYTQKAAMQKRFVHADDGPLMQVFKNRQIATRKRQRLLAELQKRLVKRSLSDAEGLVLQGNTYDGTLAHILTHPTIDWGIKLSILGNIDVEILKQEPDYLPDYLWNVDEQLLKDAGILQDDDEEEQSMER